MAGRLFEKLHKTCQSHAQVISDYGYLEAKLFCLCCCLGAAAEFSMSEWSPFRTLVSVPGSPKPYLSRNRRSPISSASAIARRTASRSVMSRSATGQTYGYLPQHVAPASLFSPCLDPQAGSSAGTVGRTGAIGQPGWNPARVARFTKWMLLAAEERDGILAWNAIRTPRLSDGPLTPTYRTAIDRNGPNGGIWG